MTVRVYKDITVCQNLDEDVCAQRSGVRYTSRGKEWMLSDGVKGGSRRA